MNSVLIKPMITEKVTNLTNDTADTNIKYGFVVDIKANKIEIAKAIKKRFNVNVISVNTVKYAGKVKTQFRKSGRFTGKTAQFKKAYVTLKKGEKIDIFDQV